jgi:hypothetical protein
MSKTIQKEKKKSKKDIKTIPAEKRIKKNTVEHKKEKEKRQKIKLIIELFLLKKPWLVNISERYLIKKLKIEK